MRSLSRSRRLRLCHCLRRASSSPRDSLLRRAPTRSASSRVPQRIPVHALDSRTKLALTFGVAEVGQSGHHGESRAFIRLDPQPREQRIHSGPVAKPSERLRSRDARISCAGATAKCARAFVISRLSNPCEPL